MYFGVNWVGWLNLLSALPGLVLKGAGLISHKLAPVTKGTGYYS